MTLETEVYMKKNFVVFALFFAFASIVAHAQSANSVTNMINTEKVSWGQVSYFSAVAQGLVSENASNSEAFAAIQKAGLADSGKNALSVISLEELAHVLAQTWKVDNSLMYKIHPSPRYAFTMLRANGIIPRNADPSSVPNGHDVLNMINAVMELSANGRGGNR